MTVTTKFPNVRWGTISGTITITSKGFQFQGDSTTEDGGNDNRRIRLVWSKIEKHQIAPPRVAKPLLKITVKKNKKGEGKGSTTNAATGTSTSSTKTYTFTVPDRECLSNVNKSIKAACSGKNQTLKTSTQKTATSKVDTSQLEQKIKLLEQQLDTEKKVYERELAERDEKYLSLTHQLNDEARQEEKESNSSIEQEKVIKEKIEASLVHELEAVKTELVGSQEELKRTKEALASSQEEQ